MSTTDILPAPASWQETMATGIAAIDNDHQLLLGQLEAFDQLIDRGAEKARLCEHLELFLSQARAHVKHEHHLTLEQGYENCEQHLREDEKLLRLFEDVLLTLREKDIEMNREAAAFLRHVMVQHIVKTDEPIRRRFRAAAESPPLFLAWSNLFLIGDPLIDSEHKVLVDYVNHIYELLSVPNNHAAVISLLHSLHDHAQRHFQSEGRLMRRLDLPDRDVHMQEHDAMLRQMEAWISDLEQGAELSKARVLEFVREWVVRHILFVDMRLKEYLQ